ncbi:MAG: MFS transporter [Solirubrobacteraceae bacterium]
MRLRSDLEVLLEREFRLVFAAAAVSLIGDGVVPVALAFAVLDLTGSPTDLGLVLACRAVALLGSLLVGGVVADRLGRREVMIVADLVRLGGQAAIGVLLVSGHATVTELAVSQALLGAASGFFGPASSGLLPTVAGPHLREANALRGLTMAASNIVGPGIAGALVLAAGPGAALLIDAASYAASALLLTRVSTAAQGRLPAAGPRQFLRELRDGFDAVRSRTWLWSGVLVFSLVNLFASAFPVLGPLVAKRHLGGAGAWAAILAARAVGALIGGTAVLRLSPRRPLLVGTVACAVTAVPTMLLAIPASLAVLIVVTLAAGIGPMVFNVPEHVRSRVSAYDWFGSLALQPLGLALVGPLAGAIGPSAALWVCGGIDWALAASLLAVHDIRTLPPRPLPPDSPLEIAEPT